jgi:haloalkane dehalogenase
LYKVDVEISKNEFKNTELVYLGGGKHSVQEDYPHEIGQKTAEWYARIEKDAGDADAASQS